MGLLIAAFTMQEEPDYSQTRRQQAAIEAHPLRQAESAPPPLEPPATRCLSAPGKPSDHSCRAG